MVHDKINPIYSNQYLTSHERKELNHHGNVSIFLLFGVICVTWNKRLPVNWKSTNTF